MRITYNETADVLTLEDETYEGYDRSVELDGMAVDLDTDNVCLGLQLFNASEQTGLTPDELQEIDSIDVTVENSDRIRVTAVLHQDGDTYTIEQQQGGITGEDR